LLLLLLLLFVAAAIVVAASSTVNESMHLVAFIQMQLLERELYNEKQDVVLFQESDSSAKHIV